jgi:hypothetical protein
MEAGGESRRERLTRARSREHVASDDERPDLRELSGRRQRNLERRIPLALASAAITNRIPAQRTR